MQLSHLEPVPSALRERYIAAGHWNAAGLRAGIESVAAADPGRLAVVDDRATWTYSQLEDRVAGAVGFMRARGIGPRAAVVVVTPITMAGVVAYFAALRLGAPALMLDRRCGRADVELAAHHPGVALVLVADEFTERVDVSVAMPPVARLEDMMAADAPCRDWPEPDVEKPAVVLFTSGSTSRPKGVVHSINTLRAGGVNWGTPLRAGRDDLTYLASPLASITGLIQAHRMLEAGGGLLLDDRFKPVESLERLCVQRATLIGSPPIVVEELIRQAVAEDRAEIPIRAMSLGGAMIPRPLLELALNRFAIRPVRMYGSSEVPSAAASSPVDEDDARLRDEGVPAPGTELRIDVEGPGELMVRGPGRFLGYLDPEHNDGAFGADGWYRTGDLARYDDGRLTITGRLKEIVARKGLKISLMELDDHAARLPGVAEAAAYGVPDDETGERLVLAVRFESAVDLARAHADLDAYGFDRIVGGLRAAGLATWKLPEQIVLWDSPMPRTSTGKVLRRVVAESRPDRPTAFARRLQRDATRPESRPLDPETTTAHGGANV